MTNNNTTEQKPSKQHSHDHSDGHHHAPENFNLAFGLAVVFNLGFTIIEAIYAIMANSMSLLADAGHNLSDVLGLVLAWIANLLLSKSPTDTFSYGFRRTTIIASLINALILVATSAIIAYESIYKLFYPAPVHEMTVIIVAFIGIFINGGTALLFMRGRKEDLNIKGAFMHLAYDALISFGVVVAGGVILWTGWFRLDPIVGIMIVVIILAGTWGLLRDSINLIMDAVPRQIDLSGVRSYLASIDGVIDVHDLHIWALSTKEIALTAHLIMPDKILHDADFKKINEDLLHDYNIHHPTIQVEQGSADDPCRCTIE